LVAAKSEREEAAKRLETAKAKHRDLLNSQVVYSRLAGTRSIETRPASGRADYVLVPAQRGFDPAGPRSGQRAVSVRRSPLHEREMPLHRLNEGSDNDAAVALNGPPPRPTTPWLCSGSITGRWWTGRRRRGTGRLAPKICPSNQDRRTLAEMC